MMRISEKDGAYVLRHDFYKTLPSQQDAERLAGLMQEAFATALQRFEDRGQAGMRLTIETIEEYLEWTDAFRTWQPKTTRAKRNQLFIWMGLLKEQPLAAITSRQATLAVKALRKRSGYNRRYKHDQEGICGDTTNKYMQTLKGFIHWVRVECRALPDYIPLDSITPVKTPGKVLGNRYPPRAKVYHEFDKIVRKINGPAPHVADVLLGMLLFCRRPVQLFTLRWEDVYLPTKKRVGAINFTSAKGGTESSIPIPYNSKKHRLLLRCREFWQRTHGRGVSRKTPPADEFVFCTKRGKSAQGHCWTASTFSREIRRRCEKLKIRDFRSYDARHSVIVWLQQQAGVSPAAIQKFAGHLRITTQEAYSSRFPNDGLPAMEAMEKLTPMPKDTPKATPESASQNMDASLLDWAGL